MPSTARPRWPPFLVTAPTLVVVVGLLAALGISALASIELKTQAESAAIQRVELLTKVLAAKRVIGLTRTDDAIARIEEQDVVLRALASLTARQRAAVVLVDFLGYSSEEAGRMLGIRPSTVRTHAERAHRDLKARMDRP